MPLGRGIIKLNLFLAILVLHLLIEIKTCFWILHPKHLQNIYKTQTKGVDLSQKKFFFFLKKDINMGFCLFTVKISKQKCAFLWCGLLRKFPKWESWELASRFEIQPACMSLTDKKTSASCRWFSVHCPNSCCRDYTWPILWRMES